MNEQLKSFLKKTWHFLWEEDSFLSWLANIILAFVLIKFVVYPGLGFILGTGYPVVAVVSGSMEHDGSFDTWWNSEAFCPGKCTQFEWYAQHGVTQKEFKEYPFKNGFNKGDIMVLKGIKPKNIKRGEIIVFQKDARKEPIIHRLIAVQEQDGSVILETKGDHNKDSGEIDKGIQEQHLLGRAVLRIPFLGWVKILFVGAIEFVVQWNR